MADSQLQYNVALSHVTGPSPKERLSSIEIARLEQSFGSVEAVWHADKKALLEKGVKEKYATAITELRRQHNAEYFLERVKAKKMNVVDITSPNYPEQLKNIYDPPRVLYYIGDIDFNFQSAVAVVGTRLPSAYGKRMTKLFARGLGSLGCTVVSGLARGVDTLAHKATLEANGRTVAVLGGALDKMYPADATPLARRIAQSGGAIISEYPPGVMAQRHYFPQRNRIVSGLCAGTLVVEGKHTSGAIITAKLAIEHNREVMAVPGEADATTSSGTNGLIQRLEAKLVMSVDDIIDELGLSKLDASDPKGRRGLTPPTSNVDLSELGQQIVDALAGGKMHVDELVDKVTSSTSEVTEELMKLELNGSVHQVGAMYFQLT